MKAEVAARLIGWADTTRETIGDKRPYLEQSFINQIITACITKLGKSSFSTAYNEGKKMTLGEAVDIALKTVENM